MKKKITKIVCLLVSAIFINVHVNGQTQIFNQDFAGAAVTTSLNAWSTISSTDYVSATSPSSSQLTSIQGGKQSASQLLINPTSSGEFQVNSAGTAFNWACVRSANLGSTTPTAVKVQFRVKFDVTSTGSAGKFWFQVGHGFADETSTTANVTKPADAAVHSGFSLRYQNSTNGPTLYQNDGTTQIGSTNIGEAYNVWTLVINHSGNTLPYTDTNGVTQNLANNTYDLWIGTTRWGSSIAATTGTVAVDQFKFGDFSTAGRALIYMDWLKVFDITPASCTTPTINTNPSSSTQSACAGSSVSTALSIAATGSGTISYQWYKNTTSSNSGGSSISGATNSSYTPSESTAGTYYYYCTASTGIGCVATSSVSGAITFNAAPTPTFTSQPSASSTQGVDVTYTTQTGSGQSNYVWSVPGVLNTDYSITSGGVSSTDNTVTLKWLTIGSKTVTVNYSVSGCSGASAASNTTNVLSAASTFYNKPNSDITSTANWGTGTDGTGTAPTNFTDAGQTFNLFNSGATMGAIWEVEGVGTKVVIGDGSTATTFNATQDFSVTAGAVVDVANNGTLKIYTNILPSFGTLSNGSTVEYSGTGQNVMATSYSNLIISGSNTFLTNAATTSISGTFTPGTASAGTSTIVFNGSSSSQIIPAFVYNNLTISGADGKSTSGVVTVASTLNMTNSFTVPAASSITLGSAATMSSTATKVLTVNGTFEIQQNSVTFSAGSGSITVAAGGTFKMSGTVPNNALAFTNVNFTSGIGASGSTLYFATVGCPRLPSATFNGNVTYDLATSSGVVNILNTTPITITGNMNILGTGGVIITQASGGTPRSLTVSGNLNMSGNARYDVSANGSTGACSLTVNGNLNITGANDTLYANNAASTGGTGTINILGNLVHSSGILGRTTASVATGTVAFTGTSSQDISTIGITSNTNITLNNSNGARLLTDLSVGSTLTLTSGRLRTNGGSVILNGTTSSIASASATAYIATCDAGGVPSTTGGLTIQNIGTGGRTGTISFPIGTNTSYNPATVNSSSAAVAFTARVNTTPFPGNITDSTVGRTWNIQPATGSPSAVIGLQWNGSEEGANFNRASASIAHWNGSSVDVYSSGGSSSGTNPYSLNSGSTSFTSYGDFGLIPGIVIPATEPTSQASSLSITPSNTSMVISWTAGTDASNSIVVVKQGSDVTAAPVDGTSYTGNAVFASGPNLGSSNYVVYSGTGTSVTVTGLAAGTTYYVAVYSFNGSNGTENYLTTSPGTANTTTTIPTYYYVGGTGNTTNTFATANMWATTLGGTPIAAFTPTNNDVFIFDGSNIGGGVSDSVTIAPISASTVLGKLILQNNARVNIQAGGTRTMTIGNSGFPSNTTVISVAAGSKLYISGSANTISLAANSSATINGSFYLGNGSGNSQLIPNASGSTISINSGAYFETNLSSSSTNPFGTTGTNLVTVASGATYKHTKASDVFGGAGVSIVSFASGSTFWYANTSNSTAQTLSGRTFGNVIIEASWNATAGSSGFTMENISMPSTTAYTFTMNETGTNVHLKGNVTLATGATFKFNAASASTYYFDGTSTQTITNNGVWNLASTLNQSIVVSNSNGLVLAGANGMNLSTLTGTSMTVNIGSSLTLTNGALNVAGGSLILNGTLTKTSGTINASNTGATVTVTGVSSLPSGLFTSSNVRNLIINRPTGISIGGDLTISTSFTLIDGIVDMGANTLIISSTATFTRTNGWINGKLRKNVATGTNVSRTYEIGDATNYMPITLTFSSVTTAGDVVVYSSIPATSYTNYSTAPISNTNYINRYWGITNATSFAFTNFSTNLTYLSSDVVGTATSSSVLYTRYNSSWAKGSVISTGTYSDSLNAITSLGTFILGDDCITLTPSISISATTTAVCTGSSVTFTAIPVNPGTAPVYQWKKNGTTNIGTNSTTLTLQDNEVTTGDVITCVMVPNNNCQTSNSVTSNGISLLVGTLTPSISISTTSDTVCTANSVTFTATGVNPGPNPVYQWKKNGNNVGTGVSITFTPNSLQTGDVISCELTADNPCQTTAAANSNAITLVVHQSPNAPTIASQFGLSTTAFAMCTSGTKVTLYPSLAGGVWSSSNTSVANVARVNNSSYSAYVTSATNGTTNVTYTLTTAGTSCTATATIAVTVAVQATPDAVTGANGFCVGSSTAYSTTSTGGVWSTSGKASINSAGMATGTSAGATLIKYTITNAQGCSATSSKAVTVFALPATPSISFVSGTSGVYGSGGYCKNKTFTLVGNPANGVWSKTGVITATPTGTNSTTTVVNTGATTGASSITYTYTDANSCVSSRTITANVVSCGSKGISNAETLLNSYSVYPNPAKTVINIATKTLVGKGNIVLTDLYGKQIKQQVLSMGTNTIDVSNLAKGIYLVTIVTEQDKQTQKIIVE